MRLLALDLAVRTGFAIGDAGADVPRSGSVLLKTPKVHRAVAFSNLIAWLQKTINENGIDMVVSEAPMPAGGVGRKGASEASMVMAFGMAAIVEGMCSRLNVQHNPVAVQTVRKHFIGRANLGNREATKRAVLSRCYQLRWMPPADDDDNRADALAIWDWAARTIARRAPKTLQLFGAQP